MDREHRESQSQMTPHNKKYPVKPGQKFGRFTAIQQHRVMKPVKAWALVDRDSGEIYRVDDPFTERKLEPLLFSTRRQAEMTKKPDEVVVRVEVREVGG